MPAAPTPDPDRALARRAQFGDDAVKAGHALERALDKIAELQAEVERLLRKLNG